jgi:hypothetical protein
VLSVLPVLTVLSERFAMKTSRVFSLFSFLFLLSPVSAREFTGPTAWEFVSTNSIKAWQTQQVAATSAQVRVWSGVMADREKREVRCVVEAVGHPQGTIIEFLVAAPQSNRAYESALMSVAKPSDIVRALEWINLPRGAVMDGSLFRFWPRGERVSATIRRLQAPQQSARPLQSVIKDITQEPPLFGDGGLVFAGGTWTTNVCRVDTEQPCSVIALYNEEETLFDIPFLASKGAAYGRSVLAEKINEGEVFEIVFKPLLLSQDALRTFHLSITAQPAEGQETTLVCEDQQGAQLKKGALTEVLTWLKARSERGEDLFVTLTMSDELTVAKAAELAQLFALLDGKGIKLYGKTKEGVFARAFLPQASWRKREGRTPQPFELHLLGETNRLTFIEEDWSGEGLDPKLTPKDYPFSDVSELPGLVKRVGDKDSHKVKLLFVFAPRNAPLKKIMPAVRALSDRLPLVYIFAE